MTIRVSMVEKSKRILQGFPSRVLPDTISGVPDREWILTNGIVWMGAEGCLWSAKDVPLYCSRDSGIVPFCAPGG